MSRPPQNFQQEHNNNYIGSPIGTIDFIPRTGAPLAEQLDNHALYAQAGFPGYSPLAAGYVGYAGQPMAQQMAQQMVQPMGLSAGYPVQTVQYAQPMIASPMTGPGSMYQQTPQQLAAPMSPGGYQAVQTVSAPSTLSTPVESEAAIQRRIQANIDSIMETQKTAMLNSKLENLTNKVQSLAHNIAQNMAQNMDHGEASHVRSLSDRVERLSRNISDGGDSASQIRSLSEKVERLSRSLESKHGPTPTESLSSTADNDIARRLRRLAAESSARQAKSEERIPDW